MASNDCSGKESYEARRPRFVSHSVDGRYEAVIDHLSEVSEMAAEFARPFGGEAWAAKAGLAHDVGKYSNEFLDRILRGGRSVDHSTAGAFELAKMGYWQLAFCVAGHHGGLPNGGQSASGFGRSTLFSRLRTAQEGKLADYSAFRGESLLTGLADRIAPPRLALDTSNEDSVAFSLQFFIRMVYSCLVDADYLCTERFMTGERERLACDDLAELHRRLEQKLRSFYLPQGAVNERRCEVLDACLRAATGERGVFSLTVPTGGGKTFASLRFALNHALSGENDMRRVIYAIPYTSIIDQNARVFRQVLGDENVLEHHSNFDFDDAGDLGERLRLASENWEAPVVVTTNVQMFESLFANKPSRCRKLHNIAGSVIVLDEAQMIPANRLRPCVRALAELVRNYGCSVVLCTATQPSMDRLFDEYGLEVREIMPNPQELFDALERVEYRDAGSLGNEELARRIGELDRVLCVVNSRRQARELYDLLSPRGDVFHLTTFMHPAHRSRVLDEIRRRMSDGMGAPCRVVATSLVEAGVDLDFPTVYRALSGIDSIVQAAGRCNREGRLSRGTVYLFQPAGTYRIPPDLEQKGVIARLVLRGAGEDAGRLPVGNLSTIDAYFEELLQLRFEGLDDGGVLAMLEGYGPELCGRIRLYDIPFEDAAEAFSLIDEASYSVIVGNEENEADIHALRAGLATRKTMRRLSRFSVGVFEHDMKRLVEAGAIEAINGKVYVLLDTRLYSEEVGLCVNRTEEGKGLFL